MRLPIHVYDDQGLNCVDNNIRSVASWLYRDWELMCMTLWKYNFHKINFEQLNKGTKYTLLNFMNDGEKFYLLERFHAIKINSNSNDFERTKEDIIKELNKGMPVSIYIDSFFCQWFKPKYKRIHSNHFCLVIGIDDDKRGFWISDGQMASEGAYLPFDEYAQGFGKYLTYSVLPLEKREIISYEDVLFVITKDLIKDSYNAFDDIRKFSKRLQENIPYYEQWKQCGMHEEFLIISQRIKLISCTLNYLYRTNGIKELLDLSEKMKICSGRWMSIYGMYLKTFFIEESTNILYSICNKIIEAANEDEKIYYNIIKIVNKHNVEVAHETVEDITVSNNIKEYYYVDIIKYANNTGFYKNINNACPGFTYGGRYYINDGLPTNMLWEKDNMKFNFPSIGDILYDNISCLGQEIKIDKNNYSYIMLLGASELGNQIDDMLIYYDDGTVEKSTIKISTWRSFKPMYQEKIMWSGKSYCEAEKRVGMEPQKAYIYAIIDKLNNKKIIEKIKLPLCPNIHIFALTLVR